MADEKKFDPKAYLSKLEQQKSPSGPEQKSEFDPKAYLSKLEQQNPLEEQGALSKLGSKALETVGSIGNAIDSYTGAPARAAIGAYQNDQNPLQAYVKQFGKDPSLAPTGKQIAAKDGYSTEEKWTLPLGRLTSGGMSDKGLLDDTKVSPAGVAGVAVDVLADPTNIIPVGAIAKGIGKGGLKAAELGARGTALGIDAVTGTRVASKIEKGAEYAARATADKVGRIFSEISDAKRAADFGKQAEIAQKFNIPKDLLSEGHEFGLDSGITRAARVRMSAIGGDKHLSKFVEGLDATDEALNQTIAKIGNGNVPSKIQAGEALRDGFAKSERAMFDAADTTYGSLAKKYEAVPIDAAAKGKLLGEVKGLLNEAEVSLKKAIPGTSQKKAAQSVLKVGENIVSSPDTLADYYDTMHRIGEVAFPKTYQDALKISADQKNLRDIYFKMRDAFSETVRSINPEDAVKLQKSNEIISGFLKDTEKLRPFLKDGSKSPERVFESLVENSDIKTLENLKKVIPAEDFKQAAAGYLGAILPQGKDGVHYGTFFNTLSKKKDKLARILDPEEAQDIADLTSFGIRFGNRISRNIEATGASNMFRNLANGIQNAVVDDLAIDAMKQRARGQLMDVPVSKVKGFTAPISDPTRGYIYRKGAQTYSSQKQNEGK